MEEKEIIKVLDKDGVEKDAELLLLFEDNGSKFIVYTFNEESGQDLVKIYASKIEDSEEGFNLIGIDTDEEWTRVKDYMRQALKETE
jgi:uncharacterized protein YrzB (UPF0473 family)